MRNLLLSASMAVMPAVAAAAPVTHTESASSLGRVSSGIEVPGTLELLLPAPNPTLGLPESMNVSFEATIRAEGFWLGEVPHPARDGEPHATSGSFLGELSIGGSVVGSQSQFFGDDGACFAVDTCLDEVDLLLAMSDEVTLDPADYLDGSELFFSASVFDLVQSTDWGTFDVGLRLAATASVTYKYRELPDVPLPAGLPLVVSGVGALAVLRRFRK